MLIISYPLGFIYRPFGRSRPQGKNPLLYSLGNSEKELFVYSKSDDLAIKVIYLLLPLFKSAWKRAIGGMFISTCEELNMQNNAADGCRSLRPQSTSYSFVSNVTSKSGGARVGRWRDERVAMKVKSIL